MSQIETLRHQVHDLVDQIDDEKAMAHVYGILDLLVAQQKDTYSWADLSETERKTVLEGYEESLDPQKLIPHEEVKKRFAKWLTH